VAAGGVSLLVCAGFAVVASPSPSLAASAPRTVRVSVTSAEQERFKDSFAPQISKSGRYVAFTSEAKLVPSDTNGFRDVYLRDRQTGTTTLISRAAAGGGSARGGAEPSMTPDGRYIAFTAMSDDIAPGDDNDNQDVVVRDTVTGTTKIASVDSNGTQQIGYNNGSYNPAITPDGRYVAFFSPSPYFVPGDYDGTGDVFVHDMQGGTTDIASVPTGGGPLFGSDNFGPASISADGRYVAFMSRSTNLVPNDTNDSSDIFLRDRQTGTTTRVSVGPGGVQADGGSGSPVLSSNGKFLAFQSTASNLLSTPTNSSLGDIYVRDLAAGTNELASVATNGGPAGSSSFPAISSSGRYVAFLSLASNLVTGDNNQAFDIFVRDVVDNTTHRVSVNNAGVEGDLSSGGGDGPAISSNGAHVAFDSQATNLVPGDKNGVKDVYARINWAS
jgi:Tol biopolymer transport system component